MKTRYPFFVVGTLAVAVVAREPARDPVGLAVQKALQAIVNIHTEPFIQQIANVTLTVR